MIAPVKCQASSVAIWQGMIDVLLQLTRKAQPQPQTQRSETATSRHASCCGTYMQAGPLLGPTATETAAVTKTLSAPVTLTAVKAYKIGPVS